MRLAMSLVNDSLLQTDMSARRHPADVAAGDNVVALLLHMLWLSCRRHCIVSFVSSYHSELTRCVMTALVRAAGALQLGASLLNVQLYCGSVGSGAEGASHHEVDWRRLVGLVPHEVDAAGHELLEALSEAVDGSAFSAATAHIADALQPA